MGEVFAAVRTGPGGFRRAVALKRLADDDSVRGSSVQRFLAEARILSSLHHPNVVEIYDVIAADHGYVLVMELLTGATVGALARDVRLSVDEVCAIADRALAGLAYIHAACDEAGRPLGLVHRDVTPNNLFVTDAGEVKLIDFGLAKLREALDAPLTRDGEIHGTLELIAPEQARGEPADPRTDLYQLAGSLYWALTGKYPHGTGTTGELITRAANVAPARLATLRPDLPEALTAAIDRAMASDRDARFADANAMRAALRDLVPEAGEPLLAARVRALPAPLDTRMGAPTGATAPIGAGTTPPTAPATAPTKPDRPATRPQRRRWWLAVAGGAALAGGGAAAWLVMRDRVSDDAPTLVDLPGTDGAVSATPLDNHRIAIVTTGGVATVDERGGDQRAIALPATTVPVDVQAVGGGRVAVTVQTADGSLRTYLDGAPAQIVVREWRAGLMAMRPDGAQAVEVAPGSSGRLTGVDKAAVPVQGGKEQLTAIAWAPDGHRLAALDEVFDGDPVVEVLDLSGGASSKLSHPPFGGKIAAFGWLDADHLAFAVNRGTGATVYERELSSQRERELASLPGERVVAGHTAAGAIALVHGRATFALQLGTTHELAASSDVATAVAGADAQGRVVFARPDGAIVARGRDGAVAPWPGAQPHDVPIAVIDGDLLVARDGVLHRLGAATTRLVRITAPRDMTVIRCAGDATAPCVIASIESLGLGYHTYAPQTGAKPSGLVTYSHALDHAVHRGGELVAIVDGSDEIRIYDVPHKTMRHRKAGSGSACERVAWVGDELVVAVRNWKQHPWALIAIDESNEARMIAESRTRISVELRAVGDQLAVATTDVTPMVSIVRAR